MLYGKVANSTVVMPEVLSVSAEKSKQKRVHENLKHQHISDLWGSDGTANHSEPPLMAGMVRFYSSHPSNFSLALHLFNFLISYLLAGNTNIFLRSPENEEALILPSIRTKNTCYCQFVSKSQSSLEQQSGIPLSDPLRPSKILRRVGFFLMLILCVSCCVTPILLIQIQVGNALFSRLPICSVSIQFLRKETIYII